MRGGQERGGDLGTREEMTELQQPCPWDNRAAEFLKAQDHAGHTLGCGAQDTCLISRSGLNI